MSNLSAMLKPSRLHPLLITMTLFVMHPATDAAAQWNEGIQPSIMKQSTVLGKRVSPRPEVDSQSIAVTAGRTIGSRQKVNDWFVIGAIFGLPIGFGLPYILDNQSHDPPARSAIGASVALGVAVIAAPFLVERATIPDSLAWIRSSKPLEAEYQRAYRSNLGPRRQIATALGGAVGTALGALIFFTLLHAAYSGE